MYMYNCCCGVYIVAVVYTYIVAVVYVCTILLCIYIYIQIVAAMYVYIGVHCCHSDVCVYSVVRVCWVCKLLHPHAFHFVWSAGGYRWHVCMFQNLSSKQLYG